MLNRFKYDSIHILMRQCLMRQSLMNILVGNSKGAKLKNTLINQPINKPINKVRNKAENDCSFSYVI